ncbi:MAG: hypothetical protein E4H28_07500 [Gemmatimonadales bacterium]|nr:MAG: hypothetical protein E4H28_07500 [Gemmatimonadales bacterium]
MRQTLFMLMVPALLAAPTSLQAQDDLPAIRLQELCEGFSAPADGQWAEYLAESTERDAKIRFTILPDGDSEGKLLELKVSVMDGQSMIIQVSVPDYPFSPGDGKRMVMKVEGQPAMVMPLSMVGTMAQMELPTPAASDCLNAEFLGMENIDIAGVTYETHHIRPAGQDQAEVWLTTDIPFGIVKAEGGGGVMLLLEFGEGAVSSITETPVTMPGMPGMRN